MLEASQLQALAAGSDELLVLRLDRDGTIREASPAVMRLLGNGVAPGQSIRDGGVMLTPDQLATLLDTPAPYTCRINLLRGEAPPVSATLVSVPGPDGALVLLSVDVSDMVRLQEELGAINSQLTNLNRERVKAKAQLERALAEVAHKNESLQELNEELQTLNEELEAQTEALHEAHDYAAELAQENVTLHQLDELKNQFVGIISHELKTPLNFVTGFASVLADEVLGPLNPRQGEAMEKVLSGAHRLDMLINELLDANKLQAGKLSVIVEDVALPGLVADLLDEMRPTYSLKELTVVAPATWPPRVVADPLRLHQVLRNLLSNAIKFTPSGGTITLSAETIPGAQGPMACLRVTDSGIGIPPEALDRLFQPFYQVDSTATRRYGGTGLGLSIVKSLVELMGGEVGVASEEGQGASFWFTLPIAA